MNSEWGEKENQDLADKFKIKKEQWPVYMFFPKDSQEGVTFQGDKKNKDALLRFVRNQGVYVGLTGCVEKFDQLAKEFMADKSKRADVLQKAEAAKTSDKKNADSVKHYVSIMKKLIETGDSFLNTEAERLTKMIKDKSVKPDKKKNFEARSNILHSFLEASKSA
jgi:endoplasmic reticulum protein 29